MKVAGKKWKTTVVVVTSRAGQRQQHDILRGTVLTSF